MDKQPPSLALTKSEIETTFHAGVWAEKFPPVLTIEEAAQLLRVPVKTLYDWSSRGLLRTCCRRKGKRLRFWRDRLIQYYFNESNA